MAFWSAELGRTDGNSCIYGFNQPESASEHPLPVLVQTASVAAWHAALNAEIQAPTADFDALSTTFRKLIISAPFKRHDGYYKQLLQFLRGHPENK